MLLTAWILLQVAVPLQAADAVSRLTTGPAPAAAFQPVPLNNSPALDSWIEDDDGDDDTDKEYSSPFREVPAAAGAFTLPVFQSAPARVCVHEIEERSVFRQYILRNLRI